MDNPWSDNPKPLAHIGPAQERSSVSDLPVLVTFAKRDSVAPVDFHVTDPEREFPKGHAAGHS